METIGNLELQVSDHDDDLDDDLVHDLDDLDNVSSDGGDDAKDRNTEENIIEYERQDTVEDNMVTLFVTLL